MLKMPRPRWPIASLHVPLLDWVVQRPWCRQDLWALSGLALVVLLSWGWLINGAGMLHQMDGMLMPMSSGAWSIGEALLMFLMWVTMMAAMMLPSAAPTILLYRTITRAIPADSVSARTGGMARMIAFVAGYLGVWILFSLVAVVVQYLLEQAAVLDSMMEITSVGSAALVLVGVGIYQWTPQKRTCLARCQSPLQMLLGEWRPGVAGAIRMGARNGWWCLGCCWAWMLLLFVVGVMNLAWVAALAVLMAVEKLSPAGLAGSRLVGLLLVAWGIGMLAGFGW